MDHMPPPGSNPYFDDDETPSGPFLGPQVIESAMIDNDRLAICSHLEKPDEAIRALASAGFNQENGELIDLLGRRTGLEQESAQLIDLAKTCHREHGTFTLREVHHTKEREFPEPFGTAVLIFVVNTMAALTTIGSVWGASLWLINSGQLESVTTILSALPLSGVTVATLVAIPLAQYANAADDQQKARLFRRCLRNGHALGLGWLCAFGLAYLVDDFMTASAGHMPNDVAMRTLASIIPLIHAICLSLLLPLQVCGEAAAAVCLKIWATRISQRSRKRVVVRNPGAGALREYCNMLNGCIASIGQSLAQLSRLEAELENGREAYVLKNIGAMRELQHRQNLASANARSNPPSSK